MGGEGCSQSMLSSLCSGGSTSPGDLQQEVLLRFARSASTSVFPWSSQRPFPVLVTLWDVRNEQDQLSLLHLWVSKGFYLSLLVVGSGSCCSLCPSLKGEGGNPINPSVFLCSLSCFKLERGDFLSEEWRERIANTRYSTAIECCFLSWIFGSLYNGNWEAGQLFI